MENDFIEMMEPTPKLHSKRCKLISFLIKIFLQFSIYIIALVVWYIFDYFIAIATLLLSFIIMGIIRSKMRNSVIPPKQREYQYNDQGIADWFTAKELCFENIKE
ncbi:hypothetical protein SMGD1_2408 [Sulfurimonas gotlandica GD1]|jgi:hypothetical protein|uniref:Uncharacterized protein n=1 Tax=Sulfurimonas gotlandica (strain DSM 19862 / JCM 16533 / GD1) TaxID=929558 RepID=B6BN63_SULGG|nr:hypothetical protein [Sulfurimonas gotlandica]EDZ61377.1 conserved hypothetical protein [Sulfurimonas gotlandica GD1]EHP30931.1 hypothetical protein SMGD1_2408 [Sulfurimonas gotlandica GD1]